MKLGIIAILLLAVALFLSSCACDDGSGNVIQEKKTLPPFKSIDLRWMGDVYLTQGDKQGLLVEAEDNIMDLLEIYVSGDELIIDKRVGCFRPTEPIKYYISVKDIKDITISGSGNVIGQSRIVADSLDIIITGSGDIDMELIAESLKTIVEGSGDVRLSGGAGLHEYLLEGSGNLEAFDFRTDSTSVNIEGSGNSEVFANENLDIIISGSGDVSYKGDAVVSQSVTGSGSVAKIG